MSVSDRTRTLLLATAALTAGIGAATYADIAAGQSAVLMVYDTVDFHIATATRTAGNDANVRAALRLCPMQPTPAAPAATTAEPAKIFDNLYFLGTPAVSAWAVTTSQGIIVVDSRTIHARRRAISKVACASLGSIRRR